MLKKSGLNFCRTNRGEPASALVITLSILVLVTILTLGIMAISRTERISANSYFETRRAKSIAMMGADNATALIRQACEAGSQTGKIWASQPGKITVFQADGTVDAASSRFLYSTNDIGSTVNLNQAGFGGIAPIASANSVRTNATPVMPVSWETVLQDPSAPASTTNRIVGRYAFWVDDETAKLNVNTADGTAKYTDASFGPGTPTEVNLTALKTGGTTNISDAIAQAIAGQAGTRFTSNTNPRAFNDPSEILQVPGVTSDVVADNNFNLTAYSRSPDLNIFGEPKISLFLALTYSTGAVLNAMLGPFGTFDGQTMSRDIFNSTSPAMGLGLPMSSLYPLSSQLPKFTAPATAGGGAVSSPLPQYFGLAMIPPVCNPGVASGDGYWRNRNETFLPGSDDYALGMRIARYLKGFDSQGHAIKWPIFPGGGAGGFASKYTDRQIDSIALQILSFIEKGAFTDQCRAYSTPNIMKKGFLSGKLVRGLAMAPRINEILIQITTMAGSPPTFSMKILIETYLPKQFSAPIPVNRFTAWGFGGGDNTPCRILNIQDAPRSLTFNSDSTGATPSPLGGFWMDNMLRVFDQNGDSAGIDFLGNDPTLPDPDQARAMLYHPFALSNNGVYMGTGPVTIPHGDAPMLRMGSLSGTPNNNPWTPGEYHVSVNVNFAASYPMKPGTTSIKLGGGLAIRMSTESAWQSGYTIDAVPLDCLQGDYTVGWPKPTATVLEGVLPLPKDISIPVPGTATIHMQVADPLVNSFPGDWVTTVNPPASEITLPILNSIGSLTYTNGQNSIAQPDAINKADPESIWWPVEKFTVPKSNRIPSNGYLQYIRTGLMPDISEDAKPLAQQKGTPYRALNFSPSTDASQQTSGGSSYPDWAMLDLFTTPAIFQPLGFPLPNAISLAWGGATLGRINPNNAILPFSSLSRATPLESVLKGVQVSTSYDSTGAPVKSTVNETALAAAIKTYVDGIGRPLMMPAEICNVPEVSNFVFAGGNAFAKSRNDLVRQVVGNLTTRSNTFSIWTIGQVIKKAAGNTNYGVFETGDSIIGESKWNVLVERHLDYGTDGTPGNSHDPGPDGVVGTPDDPVDAVYNPAMTYPLPYKYRVISAREITN